MQKLMRGMMKEERGKEYGYLMRMGSHVFFNGMALGETNQTISKTARHWSSNTWGSEI